MLPQKKINLSRFKKSIQGLIDFAILLEQADPPNRDNLIEAAKGQDHEFLLRVMRKVVFFEELIYLDESILAELLANVSPKLLSYALVGMPEEFRTKILGHLGYRGMKQTMDEQDRIGATDVNSPLVMGARKQVLKIARSLEAQNRFVFELNECPRFKPKKSAAG